MLVSCRGDDRRGIEEREYLCTEASKLSINLLPVRGCNGPAMKLRVLGGKVQ